MSTPHSDDLDGTSPSYLLNASSHRRMRSLLNLRSVSFILVLIVSLVFLSVDRFMRPLAFLPALIRPSYFNNTTTRAFSNPTAASCFSTSSHTLANMGRTREPVVASGAKTDAELTDREKKEWNHLADMMERYHNHFKHNFHAIYQNADKYPKGGPSLRRFLQESQGLYRSLDMHHRIEEAYFFPLLAKRMPQFKAGARESGEHLKSHKAIHDGIETYASLLLKYASDPSTYSPDELRRNMDSWREVLFRHLDEEVEDLGWKRMREAGFTLEEIRAFPE